MPHHKKGPKISKLSGSHGARYIANLEKENAKLHGRIAKLEVMCVSQRHRISALAGQISEFTKEEKSPLDGLSVRQKIKRLMDAQKRRDGA